MNTPSSSKIFLLKTITLSLLTSACCSTMALAAQDEGKTPHLTWSQAATPQGKPSCSLGFAGSSKTGNFITVASDGPGTDCTVYLLDHTQQNLGWQKKATLPYLTVNSINYGKGQFVVSGTNSKLGWVTMTSPDGIMWSQNGVNWNMKHFITSYTNLANKTAFSLFYNSPFVSVASDDISYYLPTGSDSWYNRCHKTTRKHKRFTNGLQKLSFGNDLFVAVGVGSDNYYDYSVYHKNLIEDINFALIGSDSFAVVGSDAYPSIEAEPSNVTGHDDYFVAIGFDNNTGNTLSMITSKNERNVFGADILPVASDNAIFATAASENEFLAIASDGSLFTAPILR